MFVGRERELDSLNKMYEKDKFEMVVMYGRRRIGKTTLISKFIDDKPAIFFSAQEASDKINLENFSVKIYNYFGIPKTAGAFSNWNDAFMYLAEKTKENRLVVAFDEFPYAAHENRALKSILQNIIDHYLKDSKLFLILCGSQITFMEKDVLGSKSPLFGRRTGQIKLEGFDYLDSAKILPNVSNEDKVKYYACIGGTPHYLSQVNQNLTFEENIKELFFNISGYLYNEPMMLLQQELREPSMYNSIISTIASGVTKLNEISTKLGEERSKVYKYLSTLNEMRIITKEYPFGENEMSSRKGVYKILDNCYAFWYRFVFLNKQEIEGGSGYLIADLEVFGEKLNNYIGKPAFEDICRQFMFKQNMKGQLPFKATSFGKWWGNDSVQKCETDIDVVVANKTDKKIILCECKYKNSFNDYQEILNLLSKEYLLPDYNEKYFYFFSKIPFTKRAKQLECEKVRLITLNEMLNII